MAACICIFVVGNADALVLGRPKSTFVTGYRAGTADSLQAFTEMIKAEQGSIVEISGEELFREDLQRLLQHARFLDDVGEEEPIEIDEYCSEVFTPEDGG